MRVCTSLCKVKEKYTNESIDKGPNYCADSTGIRTGNAPDPKLSDTLRRVSQDLEEYIDKVIL